MGAYLLGSIGDGDVLATLDLAQGDMVNVDREDAIGIVEGNGHIMVEVVAKDREHLGGRL